MICGIFVKSRRMIDWFFDQWLLLNFAQYSSPPPLVGSLMVKGGVLAMLGKLRTSNNPLTHPPTLFSRQLMLYFGCIYLIVDLF